MFEFIKNLFCFKVKPTFTATTPFTPTVQEDPRTVQSVKNVRKAFKQQEVEMEMRAVKAHASECNDIWTCTKDICFEREPDKIVSVSEAHEDMCKRSYAQRRLNQVRLKNMSKSRNKKQSS